MQEINVKLTIAVDFDGTIVEHEYPDIGAPVTNALIVLRDLQKLGHKLILYTMRSGQELQDAVDYMANNDIELYGVNENPSQKNWTQSPKVYANLYVDDAAVGCPLIRPTGRRAYVDWIQVRQTIVERLVWTHAIEIQNAEI